VRDEVLGDQLVDGVGAVGDEDLGDETTDDGLVALDLPGRHGIQDVHGSVFARREDAVKESGGAVDRVRHRRVAMT
jgi:hypothetical protein